MKSVRASLVVVCLVVSASSAFAAFDTYVSSTGSDGNTASNCARPTPCATFAAAFGVMTFSNGVIHVIDQGAYGPVTITHSVTIDGGGFATTYSGGGEVINSFPQFQINATASDIVTIMNITMSGKNFIQAAIAASNVGGLHVQHCTFSGFTLSAIYFVATGADLEMTDVTISDIQSGQGVYVANARGGARQRPHQSHADRRAGCGIQHRLDPPKHGQWQRLRLRRRLWAHGGIAHRRLHDDQ